MHCTVCKHENPAHARYCNQCGTRQLRPRDARDPAETAGDGDAGGERRQITVLFCDLVGSTRLAERLDPEALRDLMRRYHDLCAEAISAYEGRVAEYHGDGIVAYFGHPRAHEDDADRAVRSALDLQRRLQDSLPSLRARIGIHTGPVVLSKMSSDPSLDPIALGSTPHIAKRVQELTAEGGIAISEATYRFSNWGTVTDLGMRALRGLERRVRVHRVEDAKGAGGGRRFGPQAPFVGRDGELDRLIAAFDAAAAGAGSARLIQGEPGIGKSRLSAALRDATEPTRRLWADLACSKYTAGSAFHPVIAALEERLALRGEAAPADRAQRLAEELARVPGLDLAAVVPPLVALLGLPPLAEFKPVAATPEQLREHTFAALEALIAALSSHAPMVLAVEDLQWCDPSTLALLERLARAAKRTMLLIVSTARPEFEPPWPEADVARLPLARLAVGPTLEIVDRLARERGLALVLKREIADRSDGVPLFIEQLTHAVVESSLAAHPSGGGRIEDATLGREIPSTLRELLMARIDHLGEAKPVAQLASTIGREFQFAVLEKVGGIDGGSLRDGLRKLLAAGLVLPSESAGADSYRFQHALVQEVAYDSLPRSDRRRIHGSLAALLEQDGALPAPALLARHYAEAQAHADAFRLYRVAAARAAACYANDEAIECLELALEAHARMPADADAAQRELPLRLALAPPLIAKLGLDDANVQALHARIAALAEALPACARVPPLIYLARYHMRRGDTARCVEMGDSLLGVARETGVPLIEAGARLLLGSAELARAPAEVATAHLERALALAQTPLPPPTSALEPDLLAFSHATLALAYAINGRFDDAAAQATTARARAFEVGHEPTRIHVLSLATITSTLVTDFETALVWGREALALAQGRGFGRPEAHAHIMTGWSRVALGDAGGLEQVELGLARARETGFRGGYTQFVWAAGEAHRLAGRFERAIELLDLARRSYESSGEVVFAGRVLRTRGMILLGRGDRAGAAIELRAAASLLAAVGARAEELMAETELLRIVEGEAEVQRATRRIQVLLAQLGGERFRPQRAARALLSGRAPA
jgi:class 3 adenylate cyclase/tetratricopeptide (TPR) repeat protein